MYDGAISRYWKNEVIMCHGSNWFIDREHDRCRHRRQCTYVNQGSKDVQPERSQERDDNIAEDCVGKKGRDGDRSMRLHYVVYALEGKEKCRHL